MFLGNGIIVKTNFTHSKDQFAGLDLNTGFVEAFYEGFQQLEELLKSVHLGGDVVRILSEAMRPLGWKIRVHSSVVCRLLDRRCGPGPHSEIVGY